MGVIAEECEGSGAGIYIPAPHPENHFTSSIFLTSFLPPARSS